MEIGFFEEFPTTDNLEKLKLVPFPADLYLAAGSTGEFLSLREKVKSYENVKEVIYWPVLDRSEGYWMSAFAKTRGLVRIIEEIKRSEEPFSILWDAELPLQKRLLFAGLTGFPTNRQLICQFLTEEDSKHPVIVTAFPKRGVGRLISRLAGAAFSTGNFPYIEMLYSSQLKPDGNGSDNYINIYLQEAIKKSKGQFGEYGVALGIIGLGPEKNPIPLVSLDRLKKDLAIVRDEGVDKVIIYRLGGLTPDYTKIIQDFVT